MKVLVIPDVHLKPWIFERAGRALDGKRADLAVCLMDIADDWNKQYNLEAYELTYDAAIAFAKKYPQTKFCYGNHDLCYVWNQRESGYSPIAPYTVNTKLAELNAALPLDNPIQIVQRIDDVLFSHGGVSEFFVEQYFSEISYEALDAVVEGINAMGCTELWHDESPIWLRPQYEGSRLFLAEQVLQVVGHTPMREVTRKGNLISTDVLSTRQDGRPIGSQKMVILDTKTWEIVDEIS